MQRKGTKSIHDLRMGMRLGTKPIHDSINVSALT